MNPLTEDEKRIKIAEKCIPGLTGPYGCYSAPELSGRVNGEEWVLPDYFHDLNACAEMEKLFDTRDGAIAYIHCLDDIGHGLVNVVRAPAEQRCEAFGRACNLW